MKPKIIIHQLLTFLAISLSIIATDTSSVHASENQSTIKNTIIVERKSNKALMTVLIIRVSLSIALAGATAIFLYKWGISPLVDVASNNADQEEADTEDKIVSLGSKINLVANQIKTLVKDQAEARQRQLFVDTTLYIRKFLSQKDILERTVDQIRNLLQADRVLVYRFNDDWSGSVVTESVSNEWEQAINKKINDPCFGERYVQYYKNGRVRAINDIYKSELPNCYINLLEEFSVKAILVAPIFQDKDSQGLQLVGLLIIHQCKQPRVWLKWEISLIAQLAVQVGFALNQASLIEQVEKSQKEQKQQKEILQNNLKEIISSVDKVSKGDLTVKAKITFGEVGVVADFFNTITESLQEIVKSVKVSTQEVTVSVWTNSNSIYQLEKSAIKQAQELTHALSSLEYMVFSIESVSRDAFEAANMIQDASDAAILRGQAMEETVSSILKLCSTVTETAYKVKRFGESSRDISKVAASINQIALQTNVLAVNASMEAGKAGAEGLAFVVVAEEVGRLAAQASEATEEIEIIAKNIQLESRAALAIVEQVTTEAIEAAALVKEAQEDQLQIIEVSRQINEIAQSIRSATASQVETSKSISSLMKEIAQGSTNTSKFSSQLSISLRETVRIVSQLQKLVSVFKTDD